MKNAYQAFVEMIFPEKPKHYDENLPQYHLVHHKSIVDRRGILPGP
jgi:hypothetical protein